MSSGRVSHLAHEAEIEQMSRHGDVVMVMYLPPNRVKTACLSADERFRHDRTPDARE